MILGFDIKVLREELLNQVGVVVGAETSLRSPEVVDTGRDPHISKCVARLHRMLDKLEERRLLGF